jgi:rhodanese-related sulfurtransferase
VTILQTITPEKAAALLKQGAVLVDIREADEHAREKIPGATHKPLSRLEAHDFSELEGKIAIFHCRSGARTQGHAQRLSAATSCDAYVLEGGLDAWKKAGLPVALDRKQPIDLMRQVQITAGALVVLGAVLGFAVAPAFYALSAFVGAGLMFAGISGFCGMARILALMPWNRRAQSV